MILSERQKNGIKSIKLYHVVDASTPIPNFGDILKEAIQALDQRGYHDVQRRSPEYSNVVIRIFYKKNVVAGASTYGAQFYTEEKHLFTTTMVDGTKLALNSSQFGQIYLSRCDESGKIKFDAEFVDVYVSI